jgi:riboflavin kinase/FMN adenylyltransferase
MKVYRHFEDLPVPAKPCVVTIGSFDGLHRGHQLLIERTTEKASENGQLSAVMTFEPHPAKILAPRFSPPLLMTHERKLSALSVFSLDFTLSQRFDSEFAELTARDFARVVLAERLSASEVVVGDDFTFGRGRQGMVEDLVELGREFGFRVDVVRRKSVEGILISSTRIRSFLLQGKARAAGMLLGRPYAISGQVVTGKGRGRTIGFPTANVKTDAEILPARGVYVCDFWIEGWTEGRLAVTNVGFSPTFGPGELGVEVHVLDEAGDFLSKIAMVGFVERLRAERTFASAQLLAEQIHKDIDQARFVGEYLNMGSVLHPLNGRQLDSGAAPRR